MQAVDGTGIGASLRGLRIERGLSLSQVARLAKASKSSVADWEKERHLPGASVLARLLDVLGADAATRAELLLRGSGDRGGGLIRDDALGPPVCLGEVLRALRLRRRLTQAAAARSLGVGQSAWAKWESGDTMPPEETLARTLDALGASGEEKAAFRSVAWTSAIEDERFEAVEARILAIEHDRPLEIRDVLLLGMESSMWRRAVRGESDAARWLCRIVSARAQQHLLRGELTEIEPLLRRVLSLSAFCGDATPATAAVYSAEWVRQRAPGEAMSSARRLGEWAERGVHPRHRYWLGTARALAMARAGATGEAAETFQRLGDAGGEAQSEAVFHRSDLAEAYLLGDEPESAHAELLTLGEGASPIVAAKVDLALGETPPARTLANARSLSGDHWIHRMDVEKIERGLLRVQQGRRARFR